jgi:hypothetical protein
METYRGYSEPDLVTNRASLLLFGGAAADRKAWAAEAQESFAGEGPLVEVSTAEQLQAALALSRGVVFVQDVLALGSAAQGQIVRCLQQQEERPKIILGLQRRPEDARDAGALRDDLLYRLHTALVDLASDDVQQRIRGRRKKPAAGAARKASKPAKAKKPTLRR